MATTIELYPKVSRPRWLKKGTRVHCLGEAQDWFIVDAVGDAAAYLLRESDGCDHGWESYTKLYVKQWRRRQPKGQ